MTDSLQKVLPTCEWLLEKQAAVLKYEIQQYKSYKNAMKTQRSKGHLQHILANELGI